MQGPRVSALCLPIRGYSICVCMGTDWSTYQVDSQEVLEDGCVHLCGRLIRIRTD